jgi:hypothetical protein
MHCWHQSTSRPGASNVLYPLCPIGRSRCATALADRACHPEGICWCAALDRVREAVRQPHASIDVEQGWAYAFRMDGACEYNLHIARTVPQRCPCESPPPLECSFVQLILCVMLPAPLRELSVNSRTTHKILSIISTAAGACARLLTFSPWMCQMTGAHGTLAGVGNTGPENVRGCLATCSGRYAWRKKRSC